MGTRRLTAVLVFAAALLVVPAAQGAVTVGHSGWNWGNPLPQGQTIKALEFDGARGYAAGDFGTVLTTEDSGATWSGAATGMTESLDHISIVDQDSVVVSRRLHRPPLRRRRSHVRAPAVDRERRALR